MVIRGLEVYPVKERTPFEALGLVGLPPVREPPKIPEEITPEEIDLAYTSIKTVFPELVSAKAWPWEEAYEETFTSVSRFAEEKPEEFVAVLQSLGRTEETERILRTLFGLTEADIRGILEPISIEESIERLYPGREVTLELLRSWAEEKPGTFLEEILGKGRTEDTEAVLMALGASEADLEEIFAGVVPKEELGEPDYVFLPMLGFIKKPTLEAKEAAPEWLKAFTSGVGDMYATAAGASRWLGHDEIGERLSREADRLHTEYAYPDTLGDFDWNLLYNPRFYSLRVMRALPFSLALAPAAILGAYGGVGTAVALGLGTLGKLILGAIGGAALARPLESALEAGGAYDEAIDKGFSPEEAKEVADEVFKNNLKLVGLDAAQFAIAFAPMPFKVSANLIARGLVTTARIGGKVVIVGLSEAGEEAYQEIIQRQALGEEIELDAEMKEVMAIGGIMGLGLGVGGDVFTSIRSRTIDSLPADLKTQFDNDKAAFEKQGLTSEQAELKALDKVAETTEGAKIITEATEAIKRKELLNQIKPKTEAEQVAWEHMFEDFPKAATPVEVPVSLEELRYIAKEKGYIISELTVPIARMPSAKFRITGKGVRVYARDLAEVENFLKTGSLVIPPAALSRMKSDLAHALFEASEGKGYFKDVAGFRGAVEKMSEAGVRDFHAMYVRTGKITPTKPTTKTETELNASRERMLEAISEPRTDDETMPRGTVKHPSHYKGIEDFTAEVNRELFYPIKESPLDMSASAYWRTGEFAQYIRLMPDVSELKLRALSDEVRVNITELEELRTSIVKEIDILGAEISLARPTSEKYKAGQKEIVQLERDASFAKDWSKKLKAGERLTIEDAVALGIALRTTKGGKLVPAIRKSGFYVTTEFAEYPNFKDVGYRSGRWMDTMTLMEAIDGGYATGMAQKHILWPTQRTYLAHNKFVNAYHQTCQELFEKYDLVGNKPLIETSFDVIQEIGAEDIGVSVNELLSRPSIKNLVIKHPLEVQRRLVGFSQEVRTFLDDLWGMQNEARSKRGQDPIKYRKDYLAWVAESNIWSKWGLGQKTPSDIFQKPPLPDYIKPDAPFNPRAMAREGGMAGYELERDVHKLLFDYVRTAGKDIFNTNIIQNAKIHTAGLRSMGYENSARLIEDWASEAYAGVKPTIEKAVESFLPKGLTRAAYTIRRNLTRAVFPLNWMWNITIQPSSIAFTVGRYGVRNTIRGLEYIFIPSAKAEAREAYSWIIKSRRAGKMAFQDIGAQVEKNLKWEGSIIDKAENLANFLTNTLEEKLTGISIRAAYHYGKSLGFTGRDLLEYASKGGAKTQSMYNYQDVPGVLRAKPVGTLMPFQTFCFQAFNYIRELNFIGRFKAGAYETISAKSAEGQATIARRLKLFAEFLVCIMIINMVVDKATNRKPWILQSFIPFYSNFTMGTDATNPWNWPVPVQYATQFWQGFIAAIKYEDFNKLRKWAVRYHMIGGTQINRMIAGIEAVIRGGVYDVRGTELFEVQPEEWLKAVFMGPYQTEGGKEYIDKLTEKKGKWYEYIKIPLPKRVSIKNEIDKNLALLGQINEEGQVYDFGDFVSDLREMRRAVGNRRFDKDDSPFVMGFLESEASREALEAIEVGERQAWRKANPQDDARLAMWGFGGRIQTQEAYDLVKKWCDGLGVPMEHLSTWLPPEDIAEHYFSYIEAVNQFAASSAEARLIRAKNPEFEKWGKEVYGWEDIETPVRALELKVKHRGLSDQYDDYGDKDSPLYIEDDEDRDEARDKLKTDNPEWVDDMRRIEAIEHEASDDVIEDWVKRGRLVDEFSAGSSEVKVWLIDHPDTFKWALDQELLTDDGSDWNVPVLRINAEFRQNDIEYEELNTTEQREEYLTHHGEYKIARRRRDAYQAGFPDDLINDYVVYYNMERAGYNDERFLMEHPEFYQACLKLLGWKRKDFSKVPTEKEEELLGFYDKLAKDARLQARCESEELDKALVRLRGFEPAYGTDRCAKKPRPFTKEGAEAKPRRLTWYEQLEEQGLLEEWLKKFK